MATTLPIAVTILGSGTATPMRERGFSGYLLRVGPRTYLVDSGSGTIDRLLRVHVPPVQLDELFYTHTHLDHVADLFPILFSMTNAWEEAQRTRAVTVTGPPGFEAFFRNLSSIFPSAVDPERFPVHVRELGGAASHVELDDGTRVEAVPMVHPVPTVGYRFTTPDGRIVCFTGDTDACPALETLLRDADLAVAECSTPDALKLPGHLSPTPLGEACRAAGVKRLVVTHLYPPANEGNLLPELQRVFDGQVALAKDGLTFHLPNAD